MDAENQNWMQKPKMDTETQMNSKTQLLYNTINVAYLLFKV